MNIAIIFAGGSGTRMHTKDKPKQFLMVHGKPIIVHTLELFQEHEEIDGIIVACIKDWIPYMEEMQFRYRLDKIRKIVPGGSTGQLSIYNGLCAAKEEFGLKDEFTGEDNIVLIHDGVRPLINHETITDNIESVRNNGSAITCTEAKETIILVNEQSDITDIPNRSNCRIAKAPQSFFLKDILEAHEQALAENETNIVDSCSMMMRSGKRVSVVIGPFENIKITTPDDFYTFRAIYDAHENEQL